VAALGLGLDHELTDASSYMIRTSLLTMGYTSPKIHDYIQRLVGEIGRELDIDSLVVLGEWKTALKNYDNLGRELGQDRETAARLKTKIATLYEDYGNWFKASKAWSNLMKFYAAMYGVDHPLSRHAANKVVTLQELLECMEI
jgi:hypothetical protein